MEYLFLQKKIHVVISAVFKTKLWMWARDYRHEYGSHSNNKEWVGCSFVHLIYWLSWRIIKSLPSGVCWSIAGAGDGWLVSGCQDANLLRAKSDGSGISWEQKVLTLVSVFCLFHEFLIFLFLKTFWCLSAESLKLSSCCLSYASQSRPWNSDWMEVVSKENDEEWDRP